MLRSHCQPCGDQAVLCHAMSPHGLVPPKQAIKGPSQMWLRHVWLRSVWLGAVWLRVTCLWIPLKQSKKWPFAQPPNRLLLLIPDTHTSIQFNLLANCVLIYKYKWPIHASDSKLLIWSLNKRKASIINRSRSNIRACQIPDYFISESSISDCNDHLRLP